MVANLFTTNVKTLFERIFERGKELFVPGYPSRGWSDWFGANKTSKPARTALLERAVNILFHHERTPPEQAHDTRSSPTVEKSERESPSDRSSLSTGLSTSPPRLRQQRDTHVPHRNNIVHFPQASRGFPPARDVSPREHSGHNAGFVARLRAERSGQDIRNARQEVMGHFTRMVQSSPRGMTPYPPR